MKNPTITTELLAEIRKEHAKAPQFSAGNTHEAYIVKLYYTKTQYTVSVNYWTPEAAAIGYRMSYGCRVEIIEKLYPGEQGPATLTFDVTGLKPHQIEVIKTVTEDAIRLLSQVNMPLYIQQVGRGIRSVAAERATVVIEKLKNTALSVKRGADILLEE
jgi:hypothetical protein